MTEHTKPWWTSKTIWFNALAGAISIAQTLGNLGSIPSEYMGAGVAVGNILLRTITHTGVSLGAVTVNRK